MLLCSSYQLFGSQIHTVLSQILNVHLVVILEILKIVLDFMFVLIWLESEQEAFLENIILIVQSEQFLMKVWVFATMFMQPHLVKMEVLVNQIWDFQMEDRHLQDPGQIIGLEIGQIIGQKIGLKILDLAELKIIR